MNGQLCPDCATPPTADGGPACDCAERAAHAARAGRSEEIALTEDFDPLRIRPYVTLGGGESEALTAAFRTAGPLPPLSRNAGLAPRPPAVDLYPSRRTPSRRPPFKAAAIGAAVLAVIGTAAFSASMFSKVDHPDQELAERAHPDLPSTNAAEPDTSLTRPAPPRSPFVSTAPTATAFSPRSTPSQPATPDNTTDASALSPPAATHRSTHKAGTPPPRAPAGGSALKVGDSGASVTELQHRLAALWLYHGQADGQYDQEVEYSVRIYQAYRHVQGDPPGVYGPNTRRALEAEPQNQGQTHGQTQGQNQGQTQGQNQGRSNHGHKH